MLSASFLSSPMASWSDTHAQSSALTRQIRGTTASAAFAAAAGVSCDVATISASSMPSVSCADGAGATTMSCSPPRTHPRVAQCPRTLTVPHAALSSTKTKRKRSSGGGGGDGGDGFDNGDDGGLFGGGDDGFGGGGDNGGEGPADGDSLGRWMQDVLLLWSVFCAWSTWNVLQHVIRQKPAPPAFAAMSYSSSLHPTTDSA